MGCPHFGIPDYCKHPNNKSGLCGGCGEGCKYIDNQKTLQEVIYEKMVVLAYEQFQKYLSIVSMLHGKNLKVIDEDGDLFAAVWYNKK